MRGQTWFQPSPMLYLLIHEPGSRELGISQKAFWTCVSNITFHQSSCPRVFFLDLWGIVAIWDIPTVKAPKPRRPWNVRLRWRIHSTKGAGSWGSWKKLWPSNNIGVLCMMFIQQNPVLDNVPQCQTIDLKIVRECLKTSNYWRTWA